ncbi:MAG: efflux RND transporter permease subunit, partial [Lachnospiraceae bacterium]|nr:efflux RND transporter permease subunit [Lachnospiraceae bacterium]
LSLAVGILIDDAIVVIENIFRHMEMGKSPLVAAQHATEDFLLWVPPGLPQHIPVPHPWHLPKSGLRRPDL